MSKPLDYGAALAEIDTIHATKPRKTHPMWRALMNGELSRGQVTTFLRQFGVIPLYNHNYHGPLYVSCPDPVWRKRMAEVVYEEGTGGLYAEGVPHYQLYLNVGKAFGVSADEMYATKYCGGALAFRGWFSNMCRKNFVEGYAALSLGAEAQVPGVSGRVSEAMVKHYGLTPQQAAFYTVHEVADADHSGGSREFLETFCRTGPDLRRAIEAVRGAVEISWLFYEDIHQLVRAQA
jgi:pyrroloquinoline quinone (PQQ) biosynthesis protein C